MISLNNLSVQFSGLFLFDNVSVNINENDRIGLVGKNGAGKTTLLKIIAGLQTAESGSLVIPDSVSIGYLPQEKILKSKLNVYDEALTAFENIKSIEKEMASINKKLQEQHNDNSAELINLTHKLDELSTRFNLLGGYNIDADIEKILIGLGFERDELSKPMSTFSGGWQMRVELAKILLQKPSLILLDEPTNHLDIESIQWLEDFLCNYSGAVILVSHDRTFLDNVTKRTIEISNGKIYDYKASYSEYIIQRQERIELQTSAYNNQQKQIAQIEDFIERFRYKSTKARQVQSKIKMLEKLDTIEVDSIDQSSIHFKFPPAPHSGKVVITAESISKNYDEKLVLNKLDFIIEKGAKVAFVGRNGEGKSTLVKIITNTIPFDGNLKLGHNVQIGYYAQDQANKLNPEKTVFETIDDKAVGEVRKQVRNILGSFLFSGDAIDKKVKVLSGGEKSRLALACMLLEPVNLLILDEPTNHLDMISKDILKNALIYFDGTLIVVSHDRDFLQGLTDRVYEFKNKTIKEHKGDIFDFMQTRKLENLKHIETSNAQKAQSSKELNESENKQLYVARKEHDKESRKIKKRIEDCESMISLLEKQMQEINETLNQTETYEQEKFEAYQTIQKQLEQQMHAWETLNHELENHEQNKP